MIKGVNKRIIEINRTDNDYFEKAILFINPAKLTEDRQFLTGNAEKYLKELPKNPLKKSHRLSLVWRRIGLFLLGFAVSTLIFFVIFL